MHNDLIIKNTRHHAPFGRTTRLEQVNLKLRESCWRIWVLQRRSKEDNLGALVRSGGVMRSIEQLDHVLLVLGLHSINRYELITSVQFFFGDAIRVECMDDDFAV